MLVGQLFMSAYVQRKKLESPVKMVVFCLNNIAKVEDLNSFKSLNNKSKHKALLNTDIYLKYFSSNEIILYDFTWKIGSLKNEKTEIIQICRSNG